MMSRTPSRFEQTLADPRPCGWEGYAQPGFLARVVRVTRQSTCFVRSSSHHDSPSCDGQLARSPARLPVFFWWRCAQRREPVGHFGVVRMNNNSKGSTSWVIQKSLLQSLRLWVFPLAVIRLANRHWAAASSVQVLRLSPAAASGRAQQLARRATWLPARPIWSLATDLTKGLRPDTSLQHEHHAASRQRGVLRFSNLFHHHKGPAYV